jgi:hypothetical protein
VKVVFKNMLILGDSMGQRLTLNKPSKRRGRRNRNVDSNVLVARELAR